MGPRRARGRSMQRKVWRRHEKEREGEEKHSEKEEIEEGEGRRIRKKK